VNAARKAAPDLTLLAGGHSFGGRMTTTAQSEEPLENVKGLVLFSFPLHLPGRPDTKRAEHLANIKIPMLFLSGSRDELATLDLLKPTTRSLGKRTTLHVLDTANHSYKTLKKTRPSDEDVFVEMARVVKEWSHSI
jgi:predicted alpha/beta-hydrolase family hydrolase